MATGATRPAILADVLHITPDECQDALAPIVARYGISVLNDFGWSICSFFPFNERELSTLIRAFTHLENLAIQEDQPSTFCAGSTSQVHRLLRELRSLNMSLSKELEDWAFRTALNPYNPYGTYNSCRTIASSAAEYHELNRARLVKICALEEQRKVSARERAVQRQLAHADRMAKQKNDVDSRRKHMEHLQTLAPKLRLEDLIVNAGRSPNYYPPKFAELTAAMELDAIQRAALLQRLKFAQRGGWRALARELSVGIGSDK